MRFLLMQKNLVDKLFKEFGRLPNKFDVPKSISQNDPEYKNIVELNFVERLALHKEFHKEITEKEYDFHFKTIIKKSSVEENGLGYWTDFENAKQFIERYTTYLDKPGLMPMQKEMPRFLKEVIQRHGGQSVSKKLGLKYQGQLVSESGRRRF